MTSIFRATPEKTAPVPVYDFDSDSTSRYPGLARFLPLGTVRGREASEIGVPFFSRYSKLQLSIHFAWER